MRSLLLTFVVSAAVGFQHIEPLFPRVGVALQANKEKKGFPNLLEDFGDMLTSMDDVIEDFMYKRMGNGEVFYGKRKFKPSGRPNTEGQYGGMGMSDKLKIDITLDLKEEAMERRRQQEKDR